MSNGNIFWQTAFHNNVVKEVTFGKEGKFFQQLSSVCTRNFEHSVPIRNSTVAKYEIAKTSMLIATEKNRR